MGETPLTCSKCHQVTKHLVNGLCAKCIDDRKHWGLLGIHEQ